MQHGGMNNPKLWPFLACMNVGHDELSPCVFSKIDVCLDSLVLKLLLCAAISSFFQC